MVVVHEREAIRLRDVRQVKGLEIIAIGVEAPSDVAQNRQAHRRRIRNVNRTSACKIWQADISVPIRVAVSRDDKRTSHSLDENINCCQILVLRDLNIGRLGRYADAAQILKECVLDCKTGNGGKVAEAGALVLRTEGDER